MGIDTYYLGRDKIETRGLFFHLKQLQVSTTPGGGRALLGSLVDLIDPFAALTYVVPAPVTRPQILLHHLEAEAVRYGIEGPVTLRRDIAPGSATLKLARRAAFQSGVGPFPSLPANLGFSLDYNRARSITLTHGKGSYYESIPPEYLGRVHRRFGQNPPPALGGRLLLKEAVVTEVLLVRDYSVTFTSTHKFAPGFEARLKAFNALPPLHSKVKLTLEDGYSVRARVKGSDYFLAGFLASTWSDIGRFAA